MGELVDFSAVRSQYTIRRCCHKGCERTTLGGAYRNPRWYRVFYGFMSHACGEHRAEWEAYDKLVAAHDNAEAEIPESAQDAWNEQNPRPSAPPYWPSDDF